MSFSDIFEVLPRGYESLDDSFRWEVSTQENEFSFRFSKVILLEKEKKKILDNYKISNKLDCQFFKDGTYTSSLVVKEDIDPNPSPPWHRMSWQMLLLIGEFCPNGELVDILWIDPIRNIFPKELKDIIRDFIPMNRIVPRPGTWTWMDDNGHYYDHDTAISLTVSHEIRYLVTGLFKTFKTTAKIGYQDLRDYWNDSIHHIYQDYGPFKNNQFVFEFERDGNPFFPIDLNDPYLVVEKDHTVRVWRNQTPAWNVEVITKYDKPSNCNWIKSQKWVRWHNYIIPKGYNNFIYQCFKTCFDEWDFHIPTMPKGAHVKITVTPIYPE